MARHIYDYNYNYERKNNKTYNYDTKVIHISSSLYARLSDIKESYINTYKEHISLAEVLDKLLAQDTKMSLIEKSFNAAE